MNRKEYIKLHSATKSRYQIAEDLGISYRTVECLANYHKISLRLSDTEEKIKQMKNHLQTQHGKTIAAMLISLKEQGINVSYSTVCKHCEIMGISVKKIATRPKTKVLNKASRFFNANEICWLTGFKTNTLDVR